MKTMKYLLMGALLFGCSASTMAQTGTSADIDALKALMEAGEGLKFTFHRAIDACVKPLEAMEQIIDLGFDKVLTSGGKPTAEEGIPMIAEMQLRFGDRIAIMPGGGINLSNVMNIVNQTGVVNVHASWATGCRASTRSSIPTRKMQPAPPWSGPSRITTLSTKWKN